MSLECYFPHPIIIRARMVRLFTYGPTFQFQKVHFYFTHNKGQELTEADLTKFLLRYSQIFRPAMSEFHQVCCFTNETLPYFLKIFLVWSRALEWLSSLRRREEIKGKKAWGEEEDLTRGGMVFQLLVWTLLLISCWCIRKTLSQHPNKSRLGGILSTASEDAPRDVAKSCLTEAPTAPLF